MQPTEYLDAIRGNAARMADAADGNLNAPVPSCPNWLVADLVAHTGAVLRVWAYHIRERKQEPTGRFPLEILGGVPGIDAWAEAMMRGEQIPAPHDPELVPWFRVSAQQLEDALAGLGPDEPIWHWSDDNRAQAHLRMMTFETTVHAWDAENARGAPPPIERRLALDGIAQTFEIMLPARRRWRQAPSGTGERYQFVPTDAEECWLLDFRPEGVEVSSEPGDADVTLRGTASDLFLYLWQRVPAERLSVEGDPALLDRYFELVPPT